MFVELPNGNLINTEHIIMLTPLTSGATRVYHTTGETDIPEEYADIVRKAVAHKPRGRPPKKLTGGKIEEVKE